MQKVMLVHGESAVISGLAGCIQERQYWAIVSGLFRGTADASLKGKQLDTMGRL